MYGMMRQNDTNIILRYLLNDSVELDKKIEKLIKDKG